MVRFRKSPTPNKRDPGSVDTLSPSECEAARQWKRNKPRTTKNIDTDYFYSIPNSKLLTLLIVIAIIVAVVLLVTFKAVYRIQAKDEDNNNNIVGSYLSMVALPIGVVLSFVAASAWTNFADAQAKENQEATQLLLLYNAVAQLPDSEPVQRAIEVYTAYIINVEFPLMGQGQQSQEGTTMLFDIGDMIYALRPEDATQQAIQSQAMDTYELVADLRIVRMGYTTDGLPAELWWVLVLGVVIVIAVSYFLAARSLATHLVMTGFAVAALVSMLFLILALDKPYRGDLGISNLPFQIALYQMQLRSGQLAPIDPLAN